MDVKKIILKKLEEVIDPELGVDLVNLGLVYGIDIKDNQAVVKLTMTTPSCPLLGLILENVKSKLSEIKEIDEINVELVWDPPWTPERMSKKAKMQLGYE